MGQGVFGFQDAFNPAGDKGDADFDVRHRFVSSFNWDIPFARNLHNGVVRSILNGWTTSGIVSFRTGYPFTVFDTGQSNNNGQQPIRPLVLSTPPQILSTPQPSTTGATFNVLDLTGFGHTLSVNGPFIGTLGRNTYRAPGFQTWNLSLMRNINFNETKKLQLRAEFFNVFNHPNMFIAGGTNNIANGNTFVQATLGGLVDSINNSEQHRNIQLAMKFMF